MSLTPEGEDVDDTDSQVARRSWWWLWWWQHKRGPHLRRRDMPEVIREGLLKAAVETGDLLRLKQLIRQGIYPHKTCDGGVKLLSISTIQNQEDIARVLIENGCSVNASSEDGSTPLQYAAWNGHVSMVELLLEAGAAIRQRHHGESLAMIAAIHGHVHILKLLVLRGYTFNEVNDTQDTALHHACRQGHMACVRLLRHHIDFNARNAWGHTPLVNALLHHHESIARWLICQGCDVSIQDVGNRAPLHIIAQQGLYDTCVLLLQHGAPVNLQDTSNCTALTEAVYYNHIHVVRLLLAHNADITLSGFYPISGRALSPYIIALLRHNYDMARMLYEAGSEVTVRDLRNVRIVVTDDLVSLLEWSSQPRSLVSTCRLVIRKSLGHPSLQSIMALPLPPRLKRYISFDEDS